MAEPRRFPIRTNAFNRVLFRLLLILPSNSSVDVDGDTVRVRLGWAFSARIPSRLIARAGLGFTGKGLGYWRTPLLRITAGAHGWGGRWLVNGSPDGIVTVEMAEPVRAFVTGFPIRLKQLSVSLDDPEGFLAALGAPGA
jgi:hypothetical protein